MKMTWNDACDLYQKVGKFFPPPAQNEEYINYISDILTLMDPKERIDLLAGLLSKEELDKIKEEGLNTQKIVVAVISSIMENNIIEVFSFMRGIVDG